MAVGAGHEVAVRRWGSHTVLLFMSPVSLSGPDDQVDAGLENIPSESSQGLSELYMFQMCVGEGRGSTFDPMKGVKGILRDPKLLGSPKGNISCMLMRWILTGQVGVDGDQLALTFRVRMQPRGHGRGETLNIVFLHQCLMSWSVMLMQ